MTKTIEHQPEPEKDKGGRPPYVPSPEARKLVEGMCVANLTVALMAKIVGIDKKTFRLAFKKERSLSKAKANATVVGRLFNQTEKSVPAAIFWLCNNDPEHWSNRHMMSHQHEGNAARPIILKVTDEALRY